MFILPKKESFHIGEVAVDDRPGHRIVVPFNRTFNNYPVNMQHVKTFRKDKMQFSQVDLTIYQIFFMIDDHTKCVFHFETKEERDQEYEKLLKVYVSKTILEKEEE